MTFDKPKDNRTPKGPRQDEFSNRPYSSRRHQPIKGTYNKPLSRQETPTSDDDLDVIDLFHKARKERKEAEKQKLIAQKQAAKKQTTPQNVMTSANVNPDKSFSGSSKGQGGGNRPPFKHRRLKTVLKVILVLIVAMIAFLGIWSVILAKDLPEVTPETLMNNQSSQLYTQDGQVYTTLHSGENRISISLEQMPDYLIDCFIATEDSRFYKHNGIDIIRIFGALKSDIKAGSFAEGASTITMQLARNAILEDQDKKLGRKIKEALLALKIEKNLSKDEIIYYYLNEIYFGPGAHGVQLASQLYFNKEVTELTLGEAAMLTGIIRNVKIYSPFNDLQKATEVRNTVLNNLVKYDEKYQQAATEAKAEPLIVSEESSIKTAYGYPWFTDYVIDQAETILTDQGIDTNLLYNGGLHIYTTIDPAVQEAMEKIYADDSYFPSSSTKDPVESSMLMIDPTNGQIRGLVGGRNYVTQRGFNRATNLKRQPGSTIKPLVSYGPALEAGYSPASVYNDTPTTFGSYQPTNYDGRSRGLISMRTAIMHSVNIPAVLALQEIGTTTGYEFGKKLGLPLTEEDNNLSLSLGGLHEGLAPLHMAAAYAAFANGGIYTTPSCIISIKDNAGTTIYESNPLSSQVMSEQTAYLMTDMLVSTTESGTGSNAKMNRPVASKTGTTQLPDKEGFRGLKGNKDAWFAAYTPELVGVVWMGYDNDKDQSGNLQYLQQIYGGKYPARIWKSIMTKSLANISVGQFTKPSGITTVSVDSKSGLLPGSLTPDNYLVNEIFNTMYVPTATSKIWGSYTICTESKKLASSGCPQTTNLILLNLVAPAKAEDLALYAPTATCPLHNGKKTSETVSVSICSESNLLANITSDDMEGGCPADKVKIKTFTKGSEPKKQCDITTHALQKKQSE
ncbi:MAG: transglycosylase domain-containing protein [Bacillota bacterium]|jgi:penicillin-binding protein 1A